MARIVKRKRKNGYCYSVTVRRKGYPSATRTFDTKGEALAWATALEQEMKDLRYQNPNITKSITFSQIMAKYITTITPQKAITTQITEKNISKRLIEILGAETPLCDITPVVVARYRDNRLKRVSATPVRHELALLSHLFSKARKEWGIPIENPVANIERPARPQGRTRFLTGEEAQRLLESSKKARNYKFYYFILALLQTGMRASEAAGLTWKQINLKERVIFLPHTKNKDPRWVPLTTELTDALAELKIREKNKPEDLVFLREDQLRTERDRARPATKFRESFDAARKRAGLEDIHMHDLRHTAASHLIMAGVDLRTLADILGHRTLQMVQRYTHLLHAHKLSAIEKIGSLGQPDDSKQMNNT